MAEERNYRRFSGDEDDAGKQLKRWKLWCQAKMLTVKDLQKSQRGPWIYTLLEGSALESVEHLTLADISAEDGEDKVWQVLHGRFPEKESADLLGESLGEVFGLAAKDGEGTKEWVARVKDVFDRCHRRANVDFPAQARGWITLNCAGLTEEQKAIIKAKTQGKLEYESIAAAFRSCFPAYKAVNPRAKKAIGSLLVEDGGPQDAGPVGAIDEDAFQDVEAFLADHGVTIPDDPGDGEVSESEAAEALAVTWKERRKEIQKVNQSRRFGQPSFASSSSSRSFRVDVEELKRRTRCRKCGKLGHWARECKEQRPASSKSEPTSAASGAGLVQFVGAAACCSTSIAVDEMLAASLTSSPGKGVIDSGCGRTLIGASTLAAVQKMLNDRNLPTGEVYESENKFRFGNGALEVATQSVKLPVGLNGKYGLIDAAIISGNAPLLLGRPTLEKLKVHMDFKNNQIQFLDMDPQSMTTNEAGQIVIDLMSFPADVSSSDRAEKPNTSASSCPVAIEPSQDRVRKKITLKQKECRCLLAQLNKRDNSKKSKVLVAELFSPPRFSKVAESIGEKGLFFDKKFGCDLLDAKTQKQVSHQLDAVRPELLVVCPPCTHEGGWENLNQFYRTPLERAALIRDNKRRLRFCVDEIQNQVRRGGDFLFEHPWPSHVWHAPEMKSLRRKYGTFRVDMCAYGLKCPDTDMPIRKSTGLMSSKPEIAEHMHQCPGCPQHRSVGGKLSSGQSVSDYVAAYTPSFCHAVLQQFAHAGVSMPDAIHELQLVDVDMECLAVDNEVDDEESTQAEDHRIHQAVLKLHKNLGHPSTPELIRVLKHSKASEKAIRAAQALECSVCANHVRPASALPANVPKTVAFNHQVGLDVKYLPGWKANQTIPCVSLVDYGTSMHVCAPIFQRENAELLKGVLRDSWIAWAGAPEYLITDPAKPNICDSVATFCESFGIKQLQTAAEAHYQLGKVERHGQWFQQILERVLDEVHPESPEQWVDCVIQTQTAKNSLLSVAGVSPCQLVFGRNPKLPADLLQDNPDVTAIEASQFDDVHEQAHAVRMAARKSVLEVQDSKALKAAIRARPRPHRPFQSGDWVYYWRTQKWNKGELERGGKWHGAAMILGNLGRNFVVAHRRSIYRCAPEQLRFATESEQTVAEFTDNELLGIRNLLEKGQFPKSQFTDLVSEGEPPSPDALTEAVRSHSMSGALTAAESLQQAQQAQQESALDVPEATESALPSSSAHASVPDIASPSSEETYGPVRLRNTGKGPARFQPLRLVENHPEEFLEMMQGVSAPSEEHAIDSHSPRTISHKRSASTREMSHEPPAHKSKHDVDDGLFCQEVLSAVPENQLPTVDVYLAAFLQKKAQKELAPSGHEPEVQQKIDEAKVIEWETLKGKGAVTVWTGSKARHIYKTQSDRFIGSRFVITLKEDEEGSRMKARLCVQGHLDPDFEQKINSGCCHSPTMSQLARALVLQTIVSKHWTMALGDIKGAFLEAGPIQEKFRPLFARQPKGGIPGLDPEDVIEVTGNIYGSNDAPFNWWNTFDGEARDIGWQRSQFDNCLYFLRSPQGDLIGILGAHVDDTITGGEGPLYAAAIDKLKQRFPYRKWRIGSGEFCGIQYQQDPKTFEITFQQKEYAENIRPITLSRARMQDKDALASDKEVSALRAINGAANWLASQSRPDLCVQTSFSQQAFPNPTVRDLLQANQLVHRARQYSHVSITVRDIPWDALGICFHSDAAFANAKANATQAGYILGFVGPELKDNAPAKWSPFCWKSYRLPRVVSSTLGGESQSFSTASALAEWMSLMVTEAKHGSFDLRDYANLPHATAMIQSKPKIEAVLTGVTDCKSLYDSLTSLSSVTKSEDKRVAIDLAILRQTISRTDMAVRWCPTQLMIADALTKDQMDAADLLRAILDVGEYQLNNEATILAIKRKHREHRSARRLLQQKHELERQEQKESFRAFCQK